MEKPRSVWNGFAVVVKVMGPVGGKGTHTYRMPIANDSGLLFSREDRAMAKMTVAIDRTVCFSQTLCDIFSNFFLFYLENNAYFEFILKR